MIIDINKFDQPACLTDKKGKITARNELFDTFVGKLGLGKVVFINDISTIPDKQLQHFFSVFTSKGEMHCTVRLIPCDSGRSRIALFDETENTYSEIFGDYVDYRKMMKIFKDTVSEVYDGIVITDMDNRILFVNQAFTRLYGYKSEEVVGLKSEDFWFKHRAEGESQNVHHETLTKGSFHGEVMNQRKDGSSFPVLLSTTLIHDEQGRPYASLGLSRDISEEKHIREQLNEAREKAEEANKLKSNLMANMSHEVRTPLTGIIGFASILLDQLADKDDLGYYVENIKSSGERLLETMNNILMVSEIESNRTKLKFTQVRLWDVVNKSINFNRPMAVKTGLNMKIEGDKELTAYSDELLLYQVLNILLNNALKFTEEGGVTISIYNENKKSILKIRDTGVGISSDFLDQMYEAFAQESAGIRRKYQGVGLGLNICKKYIDLIQGEIRVESEKHVGTAFYIHLIQSEHQLKDF